MAETVELLRAHASVTQPPASFHTEGPIYPGYEPPHYGAGQTGGHVGHTPLDDLTQLPSYGETAHQYGSRWLSAGEWEQPVNAVSYPPRLPQYPMIRPAAPRTGGSDPLDRPANEGSDRVLQLPRTPFDEALPVPAAVRGTPVPSRRRSRTGPAQAPAEWTGA